MLCFQARKELCPVWLALGFIVTHQAKSSLVSFCNWCVRPVVSLKYQLCFIYSSPHQKGWLAGTGNPVPAAESPTTASLAHVITARTAVSGVTGRASHNGLCTAPSRRPIAQKTVVARVQGSPSAFYKVWSQTAILGTAHST